MEAIFCDRINICSSVKFKHKEMNNSIIETLWPVDMYMHL